LQIEALRQEVEALRAAGSSTIDGGGRFTAGATQQGATAVVASEREEPLQQVPGNAGALAHASSSSGVGGGLQAAGPWVEPLACGFALATSMLLYMGFEDWLLRQHGYLVG
jgi:hypothetical protein